MKSKISDAINFLNKLTWVKIINAAKIISSYYLSVLIRKPIHWGMPLSFAIEPTTACNLGCPECPSGLRAFTRPTGNLSKDFFSDTVDQLSRHSIGIILYFQGEPYINPSFLDMVTYAHKRRLYTTTSTNGHFLDDTNAKKTVLSGLDRLIISVDGTSQDTYSSYRINGQLTKVIEGATNVVKWKRTLKKSKPYIIFQFLVVQPNEHQIPELHALAKKIGVDAVKLKTAQVYNYENGHPLIPKNEEYARYKRNIDGTYSLKYEVSNRCWKMWHSAVITWDGRVIPCCFDKDAQHQLGDLQSKSFKTVWKSGPYDRFRERLLKGREEIDMCTNCTEGTKVWI